MPAYPPLARLTPAGPASRRSRALSALVLLALVATTAATFSQSGSQSPFVAAGEGMRASGRNGPVQLFFKATR